MIKIKLTEQERTHLEKYRGQSSSENSEKALMVKRYLQRFPQIHLFFLPTYSPEYNPVERIWGWMKTKIYGFSAFGGINELISDQTFSKTVLTFQHGQACQTHLLETGSPHFFIIDINAVMLSLPPSVYPPE